ncbi:hypothetical protein [Ralstonia pseudosolanacearum]|uniref:Uncharacterized protein n=1 Tax=Ralstonia solanacearum TaxID=305 RepID=A0AA86M1X0_RALSL|nr:hypothetical protein [Ralstonia pseudosolanacearum]AYA47855.1 hypothetical protein RSP824_16020 [Ralstonia pseudosolanacearum]
MAGGIDNKVSSWVKLGLVKKDSRSVFLAEQTSFDSAAAVGDFLGKDTSDPGAKGEAIYSDPRNLPTAIASIMNHAQKRANFHPAKDTLDVLAKDFDRYVEEIDNTPFFHLLTHDGNERFFEGKDYNKLINSIVGLYDGVSQQDKDKLKNAIREMAENVFSQSHAKDKKTMFSQSTIDYSNPENPTIMIYYTALAMTHDKNRKSEVSTQWYEVRRTRYLVLSSLIRTYAKELAAIDKQTIIGWTKDSTSQKQPNAKFELCFPELAYETV